jgi:hypothetical protein
VEDGVEIDKSDGSQWRGERTEFLVTESGELLFGHGFCSRDKCPGWEEAAIEFLIELIGRERKEVKEDGLCKQGHRQLGFPSNMVCPREVEPRWRFLVCLTFLVLGGDKLSALKVMMMRESRETAVEREIQDEEGMFSHLYPSTHSPTINSPDADQSDGRSIITFL